MINRAKALRHKVTYECFVLTASGKKVFHGFGDAGVKAAQAHARKLNAASARLELYRSLGLVKTPYGWE
jgi:hypothetical protein